MLNLLRLIKDKLDPAASDSQPVRIRAKALDELESEVRVGFAPRFVWNRVRVTFRSASVGEDELWKQLTGDFERQFRKRMCRLECELPPCFRLMTALSRELDDAYCIEKKWEDAPREGLEGLGTLAYGEAKIALTGQTVAIGRLVVPGAPLMEDRSVAREQGRAVCRDSAYYYIQTSLTSRTRLLREGRFRDMLPEAGLRLRHGDRLFCGREATPLIFEAPEARPERS